ncbi:glycosyltransferase [Candidatus Woesebacteria bacterium]|nr:MAG: glycosyltransferase [Candidatus Woesebacteria bacterium]
MANNYLKYINNSRRYRVAGILYIVTTVVYLFWLNGHLNYQDWWLSLPFFFAQAYTAMLVTLSVINNWKAKYETVRPTLPTNLPCVAIVVPVYEEPIDIIQRTLKSLLHISYDKDLVIIVSKGYNGNFKETAYTQKLIDMVNTVCSDHANISTKSAKHQRKNIHLLFSNQQNNAKAGNLNATLDFLAKEYPWIDHVLTQDADEIAYCDLLKATMGYFNDPKIAYVQTIKQADVNKHDPFGNHDLMWYCRTAASRNADNAMFACGSGVVWKISALRSIGGFATWNLVEDLTTSYNLLAAGWKSSYHYEALSKGIAPEDLPNFIKQRSTWALDNMRLFFWDNPLFKKGLTLRQKLHFIETPLFYLNGYAGIAFVLTVSASLYFRVWPTTSSALTHALFIFPSFITMEIYFLLLADTIPFRRIRQFWVGLAPVFIITSLQALLYGPKKKPTYQVTRKINKVGNYLHMVLPQLVLLVLIVVALLKNILGTPLYSGFDWAALFWGFYLASFYLQIIRVSMWNWIPDISIEAITIGGLPNWFPNFDKLKNIFGSTPLINRSHGFNTPDNTHHVPYTKSTDYHSNSNK